MKFNFLILLTVMAFSGPAMSEVSVKKSLIWEIKNPVWTKSFEKSYEEFVATLGQAKKKGVCHTTSDCIKSSVANPRFYNLNPENLKDVFADCADLPYVLRAYFSWMNDLPFSYPISLSPAAMVSAEAETLKKQVEQLESELASAGIFKRIGIKRKIKDLKRRLYGNTSGDIRYNAYGNIIKDKRYVKNGVNINTVLKEVGMSISTASFRTNASNNTTTSLFRDTYPVAISKSAIKPGTILYDPNGHIAVVYEVSKNGKIHLIDAHPDNSLTAITYGEKFSRTSVAIGGGFSNWRPFSYEDAVVKATANDQLPEFSLEQFQKNPEYVFNDKTMNFYEYVRNKLSEGSLVYRPVAEISELLEEICHDVYERVVSVNAAIAAGISKKEHPQTLPDNIYGTDGEWETHSSPSRDARLKASIREGKALIKKMIQGQRNGDPSIVYEGLDIVADLKAAYEKKTSECSINVKKTNGAELKVDLETILKNIYKLSFDPYHCAELRWGLTDAESLKSCAQPKVKLDWYNAQQGLRNRIDRDYAMKMDYTLQELPGAPISNVKEEDISIESAIQY